MLEKSFYTPCMVYLFRYTPAIGFSANIIAGDLSAMSPVAVPAFLSTLGLFWWPGGSPASTRTCSRISTCEAGWINIRVYAFASGAALSLE